MLIRDCRVEPCSIKRRRCAAPAWWRAAMTVASGDLGCSISTSSAAMPTYAVTRAHPGLATLPASWAHRRRPARVLNRALTTSVGRSCNSFTLRRWYESQPRRRLRLPATTDGLVKPQGKDGTADDLAETAWEMTPAHSVSGHHERGAAAGERHLESASRLARDGLQADLSSSSRALSQITIKRAQSGAETEAIAPCRTCS